MQTGNAIELHELTKYYGKSRGIEQFSLSVSAGDFFGFIGPNGAGKSTTIRTMLGLIAPSSGRAEILGLDSRKQSREILARVGYMSGEAVFYNGMRVREIIRLSAGLRGKNCAAEAQRLCTLLELDTSKRVEELSLGNRKKLSIVCAMQHEPEVYILDEPTSGLDPLVQHTFFSLLEEKNKQGATVFLSSHILSEIRRHCRHAAVIREGRLVVCAPVDDLAHSATRRVTLHGVSEPPRLDGVRNVTPQADAVQFLYSGEILPLLDALSHLSLTDLQITEPDIEETIMHLYNGGDAQ